MFLKLKFFIDLKNIIKLKKIKIVTIKVKIFKEPKVIKDKE